MIETTRRYARVALYCMRATRVVVDVARYRYIRCCADGHCRVVDAAFAIICCCCYTLEFAVTRYVVA